MTSFPQALKWQLETLQTLLCYKYRMQRNRHRIMQMVRASQEKREHRFWVHEILRRRLEKGAYYHLERELQSDAENTVNTSEC